MGSACRLLGGRVIGYGTDSRASRLIAALVAVVVGVALSFVSVSPASAYSLTGCRWATPNVSLRNQMPAGPYYSAAGGAIANRSSATDVNLAVTASTSAALSIQLSNKWNNGYDGWTTWSCVGARYTNAVATLNPYYTDVFSGQKRQGIAAHELGHALGHALGLHHSGINSAIMWTSPAYVYNTYGYYQVRPDDIAGMNSVY